MPAHIYQRPLWDQGNWNTPIRIEGLLPDYELEQAYEGRLQIINSIGPRFVKQIGGDQLPLGSSITIDEDTAEIVVSWPPVERIPGTEQRYEAVLRNADFESSGNWQFGVGWDITTSNFISGTKSGVYQKNSGSSLLIHTGRFPVTLGQVINAQCKVRQGASAANNAGAAIQLQWRDDNDNLIATSEGNAVMSASKNAVFPSLVSAAAPAGATKVNIACRGIRIRENFDLWVDDFTWDLFYTEITYPTNPEEEYNLELQVTDAVGRIAYWTGVIGLGGIYLTSRPYGRYEIDSIDCYTTMHKGDILGELYESANITVTFIGGELRSPVHYYSDYESADVGAAFIGGTLNTVLHPADGGFESANMSAAFLSGELKTVLIGPIDGGVESINNSAIFIGGTLS
jgi:hypothetical protein